MDKDFIQQLKFPVGKCPEFKTIQALDIKGWIAEIDEFPSKVRWITENLSEAQKQLVYRPGGWNIAQVVHHCADSHMNSYIRFKLALTEDKPQIRPYFEDRWAELEVGRDLDIAYSLDFLDVLHYKWVKLLDGLSAKELKREFVHPESGDVVSLAKNIGIYAWHCRHHLTHIHQALVHNGQF